VLGGAVRGARGVAGATGVDDALDAAVEESIVRAMESPAVERALIRLAEEGKLQGVLERAVASADIEDAVERAIDSDAADRIWEQLLASDKAQMLVERVAEAPEVRAAIAQQGFGLVSDIGRQVSKLTEAVDDVFEKLVLGLFGRAEQDAETHQAGLITRLTAAAIDIALLAGALVIASALLASIIPTVFGGGEDGLGPIAIILLSLIGFLIGGSVFVTFWSLIGQTPGMRFLGIRLEAEGSREIGFSRAVRRLFAIPLSVIPLAAGYIAIIFSPTRRAWHDHIAGTAVVYDESTAPWSSMPREWATGDKPAVPDGEAPGDSTT
jgi:uncharacterized RDD family membrane protein YckC